MAQFVSIYRKDYSWPDHKASLPRNNLNCSIYPAPDKKPSAAQNCTSDDDASRKQLALVRIGPCPTTDKLEFNETEICLKKLLHKQPNLINVMRKPPSFDALKKFNIQRLTSTYQADYDHMGIESIDMTDLPMRTCTIDQIDHSIIDCRPQITSRIELMKSRGYSVNSKDPCKSKHMAGKRKKWSKIDDDTAKKKNKLHAWSSEYRDAINKTGDYIMKEVRLSSKVKLIREKSKLLKLKNECDDD